MADKHCSFGSSKPDLLATETIAAAYEELAARFGCDQALVSTIAVIVAAAIKANETDLCRTLFEMNAELLKDHGRQVRR